eukprot:scpid85634/ scgid32694/ 
MYTNRPGFIFAATFWIGGRARNSSLAGRASFIRFPRIEGKAGTTPNCLNNTNVTNITRQLTIAIQCHLRRRRRILRLKQPACNIIVEQQPQHQRSQSQSSPYFVELQAQLGPATRSL